MPSKQSEANLHAVEELVHEIRENLRLKARPSHHPNRSRPSPYHIPCRSWNDVVVPPTGQQSAADHLNHLNHHHHNHKKCTGASVPSVLKKKQPPPEETIDDPYELLQQLIKNNSLVKEAVRRLQHNFTTPKQRYFYESDEESRSPIVMMCQLES